MALNSHLILYLLTIYIMAKIQTKEVKITSNQESLDSKSLKKRKGARENSLYLNWENKLILTEYQFARALGYKPIWERGTKQNIIRKKGGKENNRLRPIFLLAQFLRFLPQKVLNYLYRRIGEYSYYKEKDMRKSLFSTFHKFFQPIKEFCSRYKELANIENPSIFPRFYFVLNLENLKFFLCFHIHPDIIRMIIILFFTFSGSFILIILLLSQRTHAYIDEETIAQDEIWLSAFLIPAIFILWISIYVLKYIVTHIRKKRSEDKIKGFYRHIFYARFKWLLTKIKISFFHIVIVPISFFWRIIVRAFVHNEGFMNIFLRSYILNPFHKWLLLNGLYDRLSSKDSFTHCLVNAKTWGWKTSCYIIPNLLTLNNCSILTVDLSWELFEKTSWAMKAKWYDIKVINPTNLDISERYNPLEFIQNRDDIIEIAHILVFSGSEHKWDEFWKNGSMNLMRILISCLVSQREKLRNSGISNYSRFCTLSQLRYLLNNFWEGGQWIDDFVSTYADYETYHDWKGLISWYEETTQGFVVNALTSLNIIWNKEVAILTAKNSVNFKNIRKKKTIYYLQAPWHLIHIYRTAPIC